MGSTTDFKVGLTLEFEDSVWRVQEFLHVKPGKGPAFVRSTLKNLITGKTLDKTWKAGESFPDARVDNREMKYSYVDDKEYVFMDMETYDEERIETSVLDWKAEFIKEDMDLNIVRAPHVCCVPHMPANGARPLVFAVYLMLASHRSDASSSRLSPCVAALLEGQTHRCADARGGHVQGDRDDGRGVWPGRQGQADGGRDD